MNKQTNTALLRSSFHLIRKSLSSKDGIFSFFGKGKRSTSNLPQQPPERDPRILQEKEKVLKRAAEQEAEEEQKKDRKKEFFIFWLPLLGIALVKLPDIIKSQKERLEKLGLSDEPKDDTFDLAESEKLETKSRLYFEKSKSTLAPWQVRLLTALPLRIASRLWGWVNSFELPYWMRNTVLMTYARAFDCNLDEMQYPLEAYSCLGEFFTRRLKPGARPLYNADLISPVDGRVLYFGPVTENSMEQVKGVTYSLSSFLGFGLLIPPWTVARPEYEDKTPDITQIALRTPENNTQKNNLYHIAIYLAPGDYHGIHSPTNWLVHSRRHFPGHIFPVAPFATNFIQGLFSLNERVAYIGRWPHGFFSLTPVAATNVGNISINFDPELRTNNAYDRNRSGWYEGVFKNELRLGKGEEMGFFRLGSTVVMIFECPEFEFQVKPGQRLKLGEPIGKVLPGQSYSPFDKR
eukprot:TRINITY_DN1636_c0_g1_i1.p1 TRINITY_DN1636_c0_g1~~TRINITY_DN1636_c0_g1_i1.p1  ORF type:complete len:478 (-),score=116.21 TRINITY_DN1636_c0_g1_i1:89-1477(-)